MSMSGIIVVNEINYKDILTLCLGSEVHRQWFVKDIERLFIKPLEDDLARLFYRDGKIIGFGSWAFLSDEVTDAFITGSRKLQSDDWKSGNNIWVIDAIAPNKEIGSVGRWLRNHLVPYGQQLGTNRCNWLRRKPDGSVRKIGLVIADEVKRIHMER